MTSKFIRCMQSARCGVLQVRQKALTSAAPVRSARGFGGQKSKPQSIKQAENSVDPNLANSTTLLIKPFLFTIGISGVSFAGAAIWQYESLRKDAERIMKSASKSFESKWRKGGLYRHEINEKWKAISQCQKVAYVIIALNIGVFVAWRIPSLHASLVKYFTSNPFQEARCWSMLLSTFSHQSVFHIAANMYVLASFSDVMCHMLGKEQFVAMYLSAGVVSSLASYAAKAFRPTIVPSLGASGAIMAMLGATCIVHPDAKLSIAVVGEFIPHSFSANSAMKGLILFDTLGMLLGWKRLDHAAHLGGIAFGIWYVTYGQQMIWSHRGKLMVKWHQYRSKKE